MLSVFTYAAVYSQSVEYSNGQCYVNGALQSTTETCSKAGGIAAAILIPLLLVGLICFVCWVVSLIHVIKNQDVPNRTLWIILHFIGMGLIAGPIYLLAVKRPYEKTKRVNSLASTPVSSTDPLTPAPPVN